MRNEKQSLKDRLRGFFFDPSHGEYVDVEEYVEDNDYGYAGHDDGIPHIDNFRDRDNYSRGASRASKTADTIAFQSKRNEIFDFDTESTASSAQINELVTSEPKNIDQSYEICDLLQQGKIVAVQMEGVATTECQRIMDFLAGVVYSMGGGIEQLSNRIFIVAPRGVVFSKHHEEELKSQGIKIFPSFSRRNRA
ncbi:MAG: cell division protein SepF [Defluviitaleaceae bacterium]|nr:cell division protein SepF [Defluviitaleaceae bacterium]